MGWMGPDVQMRARVARVVVAVVCSTALVSPKTSLAAPPIAGAEPDLKAVESGFAKGMEEYERGDYQAALKTWNAAVAILPETPEHRPNRIALYENMVKAYQKELERVAADASAYEAIARDALLTLDGFAQGFSAAYPDEPLPQPIVETRDQARGIVTAAEELRKPVEAPPQPPPPKAKPQTLPPPPPPWKPFAIGGGVALGVGAAMLGVFAAGFGRAKSAETEFDDPANSCNLDDIQGPCASINARGKSGNTMATAGLVTAPLFLGAGIAMLVVAAKRKSTANRKLAPVWSPTMAGMVFEQRF